MLEKILLWILVKVFNWLQKKYPDGEIGNLAIIEVDKLEANLQSKLDKLTPQEAQAEIVDQAKQDFQNIVNVVKTKLLNAKNSVETKVENVVDKAKGE